MSRLFSKLKASRNTNNKEKKEEGGTDGPSAGCSGASSGNDDVGNNSNFNSEKKRKAEKSGFDVVDSKKRVPPECVPDKSSSADQGKSDRLSTKVTDIPYDINSAICLKMNAKDMLYKDYRLLGEKMGYSKDVTRDLERKDNPTDALLQLWSKKPEATVQNLIALLKDTDLERVDVATILEDWVEGKSSK